jgi:NTP pyrophosphatase (non-canonical NTP hydrolase)
MNMNEYQDLASRSKNKELDAREEMLQDALGVAGEAGECADLVKKHAFHGHPLDKDKLTKELGDVLWYVSQLAGAIGVTLDEVAEKNIAKLKARYPEGFTPEASLNRKM